MGKKRRDKEEREKRMHVEKHKIMTWIFFVLFVSLIFFPYITIALALITGLGLMGYILCPSRIKFEIMDKQVDITQERKMDYIEAECKEINVEI